MKVYLHKVDIIRVFWGLLSFYDEYYVVRCWTCVVWTWNFV